MVERPRDAFVGVDVPAGRALEPAAGGELKASAVVLALEGHLGHDRVGADHLQIEARAQRLVGEAQLHQRGLEQDAAIAQERQQLRGVLAADVDRGVARVAALEARQDAQRVAVRGGRDALPVQGHAGQQRRSAVDVEHGHGQAALAHVHAELQVQRALRAVGREPGADARRARAQVRRRGRRVRRVVADGGRQLRRLLLLATAPISASAALARLRRWRWRCRCRTVVARLLRRWRVQLLRRRLRGRFAPRQRRARFVAHGDQQRGHVLAVLIGLLESGARAAGGDALATQPNRDLVRIRIGALDATLRARVVDADLFDDFALLVVEATKEGASAEQASKAAVGERGESVRQRRHGCLVSNREMTAFRSWQISNCGSSCFELEKSQRRKGVMISAAAAVALTSSCSAGAAALPKMSDKASAVMDVVKAWPLSRPRFARRTLPSVARAASTASAVVSPVSEATTTNQLSPWATSSEAGPRNNTRRPRPSSSGRGDASGDRQQGTPQRHRSRQLDAALVARRVLRRHLRDAVFARETAQLALDFGRDFTRAADCRAGDRPGVTQNHRGAQRSTPS